MVKHFSMYLLVSDHMPPEDKVFTVVSIDKLNKQISYYTSCIKLNERNLNYEASWVSFEAINQNPYAYSLVDVIKDKEILKEGGIDVIGMVIPNRRFMYYNTFSSKIVLTVDVDSYKEGVDAFNLYNLIAND